MQDVPVEEVNNLAVRVIQAPNTGSSSIPNNVVWLDLQVRLLIQFHPGPLEYVYYLVSAKELLHLSIKFFHYIICSFQRWRQAMRSAVVLQLQ